MKAKILTAAAVATMTLGLLAAPAHGHPGPAEHDHFLDVPGNDMVVQFGPKVCSSTQLHRAFHNFHSNVHVAAQNPTTVAMVVFCS